MFPKYVHGLPWALEENQDNSTVLRLYHAFTQKHLQQLETAFQISTLPAQGKEEMSESADVGAPSQSFFEAVCGSQKHSQRAAKHIGEGVTGIVDRVQVLLVYWEKKYKTIWETDKDAFIR